VHRGDFRKDFSYLRQSHELAVETGDDVLTTRNEICLNFIDALKFGSNEGLDRLRGALNDAQERHDVREQIMIHEFLGRVFSDRRQKEPARTHLESALTLATESENHNRVEQIRIWLDELL
jgi:uncharacterized protein HemY